MRKAERVEKEKSEKDKGIKPVQGSMILDNPSVRTPGQRPAVIIPKIFLHSIANKLYPPLNWFTNDRLEYAQHCLHDLHSKLIHPKVTPSNPSLEKTLVFDMTKMYTLWGSDETHACLTPLKWQEASANMHVALVLLLEHLLPAEQLIHFTYAGEFEKHRSFFIGYKSFEENYAEWYTFKCEARHDILQKTLFNAEYYIGQVNGRLHAKEAALSCLSPPSSPMKHHSESDLSSPSKVAQGTNDSPSSFKHESTPARAPRTPGSSSSATCITCCGPHKLRDHPLGTTSFADSKPCFLVWREGELWVTCPSGSGRNVKICIDFNLPGGCRHPHDLSRTVKPVQPRSKQREIDRKSIVGIDRCRSIDDLGWTFEVTGLGEAISNTLNTL
ncbi:hypothetical protein BT96DRAFT_1098643 [Gymnopus androsaceus JB14]|uniref:Uncharacterized protein n=1 Tax=Gymnopus androsaceus JB14 TaxID=1447944 RepID=A0A6A4GFY6_9AGAR|nr:hypothetical protein BT96DRAFT_1098643 [Gymnopus androsaceus JB14]